mmetsp:Transcript_9113/g.12653  ORF Transcript_9113/g.12653 Transcript_9113/m.12653 type:complete len:474 (-) Transcript_9113:473-1894(-)
MDQQDHQRAEVGESNNRVAAEQHVNEDIVEEVDDEDDDDDLYDIADDEDEEEEHDLLDDEVSDEDEDDVNINMDHHMAQQNNQDAAMEDASAPMEVQHQQQQRPPQQQQQQEQPMPGGARHQSYPPQQQQPIPRGAVPNGAAADARGAPVGAGGGGGAAGDRPDMEDEPGLDGYQRTDLIGQGAYGIVYRGTQRSTGDTVAIKRIPFADATPEGGVPCNVIREISLLRELDHPNVVRLLDVIQAQPGGLYLVFEYVAHDLKTFMDQYQTSDDISERRGLPVPMVRSFMRQILAGVGFCHTYRVLHRDLKPHNLLISANGTQLKLADFGLARLSGLPNGPYTYEVVTLWYRAPELLLGASRYSAAVDVWSVGCIFAEMATGMPLFPGRSDIDQLFKIFQRRGTPTPEMWPACTRLPHYNPEFPNWPEHPITDFVNLESLGSNSAADLLTQILQYDPDRRIVCRSALQHPYFFEQ